MFVISIITAAACFATYSFWKGKTMTATEVKKKWGSERIDYKKFKMSTYEIKSKMAFLILTDKKLINKTYEEIREIFGPNDGYYFTDTTPAYIVQIGKDASEDTWQLVFKMNNDYKVSEVIMHKNCCEQ